MRSTLLTVVLSALALGQCTMVEEPLWSGNRLKSGVAPFRDLGGVEICVADHRLGTPDTELAGFCVPKSQPARATCAVDADCRSRESCVCGFCTVKYCTRNDECGGRTLDPECVVLGSEVAPNDARGEEPNQEHDAPDDVSGLAPEDPACDAADTCDPPVEHQQTGSRDADQDAPDGGRDGCK